MPVAAKPPLEPGRVYRTRDLMPWSRNPSRLARRLVREGQLRELNQGLFFRPNQSRFGAVPPSDDELMRGFLGEDSDFVFTGPDRWNTLGLGTTEVFAAPLVYNTKRSGPFRFGNRRFNLRRVAFPSDPPAEWYVVDLFEHAEQAGASRTDLARALRTRVAAGAFDSQRLMEMASRFGTKDTQARIKSAISEALATASAHGA